MNTPGPKTGFRGYVFSRSIGDHRVPQHIQNMVLRDYAGRNHLFYKLSATEYAMDGSYLMFEQVLNELPSLEGVILYSMFMLPSNAAARSRIYGRFLVSDCALHAAVESFTLKTESDVERWENILMTEDICRNTDYGEIEKWLM